MKKIKIKDITHIALSAAFIAVCSVISIPTSPPITLQTFAVFCTAALFGTRKGTLAALVYLALGAAGLPVFSAFRGGVGHLFSQTGGYLLSLIAAAFIVGLWKNRSFSLLALLTVIATVVIYTAGTLWFALFYASDMGITELLTVCVFPFIIPDAVKTALAIAVIRRISKKYK